MLDTTGFTANRRSQRLFDAPAKLQASSNGLSLYSGYACPIHQGLSSTGKRKSSVIGSVFSLCRPVCPAAIRGLVIAGNVDSIDRILIFGALPHIAKEGFKRIPPANTYLNAFRSVMRKASAVRVVTSRDYRSPGSIFGSTLADRVSVSFFVIRNSLVMVATAAFCSAVSQVTGKYLFSLTAIASAIPVTASCITDYGKLSEPMTL